MSCRSYRPHPFNLSESGGLAEKRGEQYFNVVQVLQSSPAIATRIEVRLWIVTSSNWLN